MQKCPRGKVYEAARCIHRVKPGTTRPPNRKDYCKAALAKLRLSRVQIIFSKKPSSVIQNHTCIFLIVRHLRVALSFCLKTSLRSKHYISIKMKLILISMNLEKTCFDTEAKLNQEMACFDLGLLLIIIADVQ